MTAFLMIFRRFPTTFRRFSKIVLKARRTFPNIFRKFPKIAKDFRRRPTLRTVSFSYAKRERNHCEQLSAFPSSMRELVTSHVMHLMPSSFVNNFFRWKCFGTKETRCISPKALTKERFNSHCIFVIILRK